MKISEVISNAEEILPGTPAPEGELDPRWQAIIKIGEFIDTNPEEVWSFTLKWGSHEDEDLRAAISTCLLEHLLEYHFNLIFPRLEKATLGNSLFAHTVSSVGFFGQSKITKNRLRLERLKKKLWDRR